MILKDVNVEKREVKIGSIIFDEEIYARMEPDQSLISRYEENADQILDSNSRIQVSKDLKLIDGYHRLKAFQRVYGKDKKINVDFHDTDNRDYIELKSYAANTTHGQTNTAKENKRNISRLYARGFELDRIQDELGLSKSIIYAATKDRRAEEKQQLKKDIFEMYLRGWNTQQDVADEYDVSEAKINNVIKKLTSSTCGEFEENFKPLLYNIWNLKSQDNERKHFGAFPEVFLQNLLHYHTEPMDLIYDPFAGGGTTADVCKEMARRYYCSDRRVVPGREKDIREHDIAAGLPDDLQKPDMVFLDPPYWLQAENQYSEDEADLGNMSLEDFNKSMERLFNSITKRGVDKIALVIQPTQYKNDFNWTDHIFDFDKMLPKYDVEMRYILPYSSQQYQPQNVIKAKKENKALCLNRDLIIWSKS
jgi:hypothetical protein